MKKSHSNYYNQPFYAVFRRDKDGNLEGYVEHSFAMGWSKTHVRIFPRENLHNEYVNYLNEHVGEFCGRHNGNDYEIFFVRVRSKKSPVDIILDPITNKMTKYDFRNKQFTIKQ